MSRDDSGDRRRIGSVNRRKMLMALGGGAAIGLAGQGMVGAQDDGEGDGGGGGPVAERCDPCIDAYSGYLLPAPMEAGPGADAETADGGNVTENQTTTNQTAENQTGADNETDTNGQMQEVPFDVAQTVDLRVTDADVVFVEEEGEQPGGPMGNQTEGNQTVPNETANGNETPAGNETVDDGPGGGNETAGNETAGEGPEGPLAGPGGFPDFYFDPVGVSLQSGDVVEFVTVEDFHTVTAYHPRFFGVQQRVPEGVPGFTSPPFVENDAWYYRFDEPGVYDLQCLPHETLGMVMRVVVDDGSGEAPEAPAAPGEGEMGPSEIAQTVLDAPELEPGNVLDQGTVAWEDLTGVESEPPFGP
ncbi:hypothetical protein G9464_13845 [Halostella sp. JP-L12]|uniref:cupredoxin domain-containing protein n=1 Tax=Halostella TaxID=1843185 RepID=UPI000EF75AC5|nr:MULTISPECIES: plastocyanin/azurin family copper-binding protein [Halostella]NHN48669.1 hypothetical protein [Halostella sp. JP-L12]